MLKQVENIKKIALLPTHLSLVIIKEEKKKTKNGIW